MGAGGRGVGGPPREGAVASAPIGRVGSLVLLALSVTLAIALAVSLIAWQRDRADLQDRIDGLTQQAARAQLAWKSQLAACTAAASPQRVMQTGGGGAGDDAAQRLLARGPEGIDVCARMESADQAVLATLK